MTPLAGEAIFVTLAGSHAHGTAQPGSDVDVRGVCIAPLRIRVSLFHDFEQFEGPLPSPLAEEVDARIAAHPTAAAGLLVKTEAVVFDLAKLLALAANANPNALEILFADERDWLVATPAWRRIHEERARFLSKKVEQTYLGYAMAQLRKIRSHREWLLHPPESRPSRSAFGLPDASPLGRDDQNRIEQLISERVRSYGIGDLELPKPTRIAVEARLRTILTDALSLGDDALDDRLREVATSSLQLPGKVIDTLEAEKRYRIAVRQWEAYETWKRERNPARAKLEQAHGYDTKHAMHLLRLMQTGLELLETGVLHVRRPNAAELVAVRNGSLSYDELLEHATALEQRMRAAAQSSTLPRDVDFEAIDGLAFEVIERASRADGGA